MIYSRVLQKVSDIFNLSRRLEDIQQALGRIELRQVAEQKTLNIFDREFKVFSQNGEDGIIQYLLQKIDIPQKVFIEFGVHDYKESNTRFLLQNNNWAGLIFDGSKEAIDDIKSDSLYWRYNLSANHAFITKDNINDLIRENGITGDIGLLSVDIDGNDYWVWEAIECVQPRIVICEYNSLFGDNKCVTTPYEESFLITKAHFSGLYWGASIGAFDFLAKIKGYSLVGSNSAGNNVFFVRDDVLGDISSYSYKKAYVKSQFRISRDENGNLSYLDFDSGRNIIAEMPLIEVDSGSTILVKDTF